jgi:hypothetical protein
MPSLASPQAFVSIIAALLLITAITVWQKASWRNVQKANQIVATASDIKAKKTFQQCMTVGQRKFDDGDWSQANTEFQQFAEQKLSPQEETRLSPLVYEQLQDLHQAAGQTSVAKSYEDKARQIRVTAANEIVNSVQRQLAAIDKEMKSKSHANTDLSDALGDMNEQAHLCEYLGAYDQAKKILTESLNLTSRYMIKNDAQIGRTYKNLAYVLLQKGAAKEAREFYTKALVIRHRQPGYFDEDLIRTLRDAAALELQMNDFAGAHKYLDEAIAEAKNRENINTPLMAYLHVLRAKVFMAAGALENVDSELQEAKNIYAQTPIDSLADDQKASCLMLLAQAAINEKKQNSARKMMQDAISLYEQAPRKNWADFADALDNLAKNYLWEAHQPAGASPPLVRAQHLARAYPLIKRAQAIRDRLPKWQTQTSAGRSVQLLNEYQNLVPRYLALGVDMHPGHLSK